MHRVLLSVNQGRSGLPPGEGVSTNAETNLAGVLIVVACVLFSIYIALRVRRHQRR